MMLRLRYRSGAMAEYALHPQYTFAHVVEALDTALDADAPVVIDLATPGQSLTLNPDAMLAVALVES